ncbi:MAG: glycosyltransferase family 39 protein [Anaerolineaceae bacterium]|nr:glycosyltransferase family 39 protein [Anaerolineaceae bacterium]
MKSIPENFAIELKDDKLFNKHHLLYVISIVVILLIGLLIRFYDLTEAPLDFHPTRQLYSAIKARGMFYQDLQTVPAWQKEFAVGLWQEQGLIEPPVMERLTAFAYKIIGEEVLWVARIFSIFFWTLGGLALLSLTKRMIDRNAAVVAFLLFMVTPYTAIASRAFQPDPLMVMLMIFAIWGMVRWIDEDNIKNAIFTGLFSGLAIFIKSVVIFPLAFALIAIVFSQKIKIIAVLRSKSVWIIGVLAILPYILYMIYGLIIIGDLQSQFSLRFFPQMWIDPVFWLRWIEMINHVVGFEFFLAAIIGIFLLRKTSYRILLSALFIGYFIYGITLPYHMSTHDYYQLPLVPIVAIGVSVIFSQIIAGIKFSKWVSTLVVLGVLGLYMLYNAWDVRVTLARNNYDNEVKFWENMSGVFEPDDRVIGITQDYGYRLNYWSWTGIENWMSTSDFSVRELAGQEFDLQSLFKEQTKGMDYFLVTQMSELNNQPEIREMLFENYQIREETGDYIIFDLNQKIEN